MELKDAISEIVNVIIKEEMNETQKDFSDIIEKIVNIKHNITNPAHFDLLINYELDRILKAVVLKLNKEVSENNEDKIEELYFLYKNYGFLAENLAYIIKQKEGSSACVDKSRKLLKYYKQYIIDNTIPILSDSWDNPKFGTGQQWINLCEGLVDFYYGLPDKYLECYKDLLSN